KNILIDTESKFRIFSMVLFIRGIPTFFAPYYSKSLGPEKIEFDLDLGESTREGYFAKTRLAYPFTENSKTYIGIDYMTIMGIGLKAGHAYSSPGGELDLDWYYVNETKSSTSGEESYDKKHNLSLDGWQQVSQNLRIRGKTEYTDDRMFRYRYDRQEGFEYMQQELDTRAGLEYSKSVYYGSVFVDKSESWDMDGYRFDRYIMPGLKLRIFPVGLPLNSSISADSQYQNRYMTARENWQPYFDWNIRLVTSHRLDISRPYHITLSPGIDYSGDYVRYSKSDDTLTHYMSLFSGLRQGIYDKVFLESDYQWKREIGPPYRIAESKLSQRVTYRPYTPVTLMSRSSYDFRKDIKYPVGDFFSTLTLDLPVYYFFVRNRYDYHNSRTKDWLFELEVKENFNSTVKYDYLHPLRLELGATLTACMGAFEFTPGARAYLEKSAVKSWDYSFDRVIEKSLTVKWDMHCWESSLQFRNRGDEYEFWVLFNISAFPETKSGLYGDIITDGSGNIIGTDYRFHRK
ncbi:MAG: hypothetical protein U9R36_01195, partial [Elusimicrobiota bacterium]|nr:hypothetical protein [Elusimicrobiota bacterium]